MTRRIAAFVVGALLLLTTQLFAHTATAATRDERGRYIVVLADTVGDPASVAARLNDGPIVMVNLLKFREQGRRGGSCLCPWPLSSAVV